MKPRLISLRLITAVLSATALSATALSATVLLAGCGGPDDELASVSASSPPAITTDAPSPSATPGAASNLPGTLYADPGARFSMMVANTWKKDAKQSSADSPVWAVGKAAGSVTPSVALAVDDPQGASPQAYLKTVSGGLTALGFKVIKSAVIPGTNTANLGAIEYTGPYRGTKATAHYLVIMDLNEKVAAAATLVTPEDSFKQYKGQAVPYLRTLAVT